ncbi:MAG: hypothetical protein ABJL67_22785 [Sulfitobacter sp.]
MLGWLKNMLHPMETRSSGVGYPLLTDELMEWIEQNDVNMDWLFGGNPSVIVKRAVEKSKEDRPFLDYAGSFESELKPTLVAMLRAVVFQNVPVEEAHNAFSVVVQEFRADPNIVRENNDKMN